MSETPRDHQSMENLHKELTTLLAAYGYDQFAVMVHDCDSNAAAMMRSKNACKVTRLAYEALGVVKEHLGGITLFNSHSSN